MQNSGQRGLSDKLTALKRYGKESSKIYSFEGSGGRKSSVEMQSSRKQADEMIFTESWL